VRNGATLGLAQYAGWSKNTLISEEQRLDGQGGEKSVEAPYLFLCEMRNGVELAGAASDSCDN
jgi:hypothetical protein